MVPMSELLESLRKWVEDTLAKNLLPATSYDLMVIQEVTNSEAIERCEEDLNQRHHLSLSKLNDVERFARFYCSLLLRAENPPVLDGIRAYEQKEKQISSNKSTSCPALDARRRQDISLNGLFLAQLPHLSPGKDLYRQYLL